MNIILIGAPGSGKGTQARRFIEKFNFIQLSTGDVLRSAIDAKSQMGLLAQSYMDQGKLVPDDVIINLVDGFISSQAGKSVIFDGFPRTLAQASSLKFMLKKKALTLDKVIYFKIESQVLVKRLTGRRTCSQCGEIYHIETKPSSQGQVCEKCGGPLTHRPDDKEEIIIERLAQYEKNNGPILDYYVKQGILAEVDSSEDSDLVFEEIIKILGLAN